jgi:hypothetical protein
MLLCCRGAGKSRATSAKALHRALLFTRSLVLVISHSQRQSGELFRYVLDGYRAVDRPVKALHETMTELELVNGSRNVCSPLVEVSAAPSLGTALCTPVGQPRLSRHQRRQSPQRGNRGTHRPGLSSMLLQSRQQPAEPALRVVQQRPQRLGLGQRVEQVG